LIIHNGIVEPGLNSFVLLAEKADLKRGVYFLIARWPNGIITQKVLKLN
jgi:hypothetical protein